MHIQYFLAAAQGRDREFYEDNFFCDSSIYSAYRLPLRLDGSITEKRQFYAVFDGMSKDAEGKMAAHAAAKALQKYRDMLASDLHKELDKYIIMYFMEANMKISEMAQKRCDVRIGTSAALFCIDGTMGYIYNIGDSRIYLLRNKKLYLLSEEHTEANRLYRLGAIDDLQYHVFSKKRRLTQYLGIPPEEFIIKPYKASFKVKKGDRLLLCTNGITRALESEDLKKILQKDTGQYAAELIDTARSRNAKDDCTAIVCTIVS